MQSTVIAMQNDIIGFTYVMNLIECHSPYGRRALRSVHALSVDEVRHELDRVEMCAELYNNIVNKNDLMRLEILLSSLKDIHLSISMLNNPDATLDEVSLFEIKRFCLLLREIAAAYNALNTCILTSGLHTCSDVYQILNPDKSDSATFYISESYSPALRDIRQKKRALERALRTETCESKLAELKAERVSTVDAETAEELNVRTRITERLRGHYNELSLAVDDVQTLDFALAKGKAARVYKMTRPEFSGDTYEITDMYNPMIADSVRSRGGNFTPVSITLPKGVTVITGANMGGKSVTLKSLALNAKLAAYGFFVFAKKAVLPLFSDVMLISDEYEDYRGGLSSFGGEIAALNDNIGRVDERALLLADEFARGTNPEEGAIIVRALVKYLSKKNAFSVVTTHYDGACKYATAKYRVIGLRDFFNADTRRSGGVSAIEKNMNYGLYRVDGDANDNACPREARNICKYLITDKELLDAILSEN